MLYKANRVSLPSVGMQCFFECALDSSVNYKPCELLQQITAGTWLIRINGVGRRLVQEDDLRLYATHLPYGDSVTSDEFDLGRFVGQPPATGRSRSDGSAKKRKRADAETVEETPLPPPTTPTPQTPPPTPPPEPPTTPTPETPPPTPPPPAPPPPPPPPPKPPCPECMRAGLELMEADTKAMLEREKEADKDTSQATIIHFDGSRAPRVPPSSSSSSSSASASASASSDDPDGAPSHKRSCKKRVSWKVYAEAEKEFDSVRSCC
jgi:hypothetical protein